MGTTIRLFYVGEGFYWKSGTAMGSIYEVGTMKRWDWGFVRIALGNGAQIHIRPANKTEMDWAKTQLGSHLIDKQS